MNATENNCFLQTTLGLSSDQGGHKPGKHGKPGKLREVEKLSKSGKTQGNLNFCRKNLENSGKMKLCDMIANKNAFHRIFLS